MQETATWQSIFRPGQASDFFEPRPPGAFDPAAGTFNPVNAWWLSELSRLVYRRDAGEPGWRVPPRADILARVGLRERQTFRHGGMFAFLVESAPGAARSFAVLAFRGSSGRLDNWLSNFAAWPSPWPTGGRVHGGFKEALLGFWPQILEALRGVDRPLFYTGHSLGAALATLAASLRPPRAVYTFGSPRVGDARFARLMAVIPVHRIAAARDVVTQIPPAGFPFGYRHVGRVCHFPSWGLPAAGATGPGPLLPVAGGWRRALQHLTRPPVFLADHAPVHYRNGLAV